MWINRGWGAIAHTFSALRDSWVTGAGSISSRRHRPIDLQAEADARVRALEARWAGAQGTLEATLQERAARVRNAYDARSAKISQAWGLIKPACGA